MTHSIFYIVSTLFLSMSLVYATPNGDMNPEYYWIASKNLLEFLAVFEGVHTNRAQFESEENNLGQHYILADIYVIPVEIPAFVKEERITFLGIEKANGAVHRTELFEIFDEENKVIRIKRYNLTSNSEYDHRPIEELQPEKLDTNPECDALFEKMESAVYIGTFPNCRLSLEGQRYPVYVEINTCSSIFVNIPTHAIETPNVLPYILKKTESFPLALPEYLFGPGNYSWRKSYAFVNPC